MSRQLLARCFPDQRRIHRREVRPEGVMLALESRPRRIDDERRKAEERGQRLQPPAVVPHRLAKAATRNMNQVRCHKAPEHTSLSILVCDSRHSALKKCAPSKQRVYGNYAIFTGRSRNYRPCRSKTARRPVIISSSYPASSASSESLPDSTHATGINAHAANESASISDRVRLPTPW